MDIISKDIYNYTTYNIQPKENYLYNEQHGYRQPTTKIAHQRQTYNVARFHFEKTKQI